MKKSSTARKTFATVLVGALALGAFGTSTAVAGGLITSKQIKNDTIKSKDVKDNSLKGKDVRDGSLGAADLGAGAVTAADLGTVVARSNGVAVADGSGATASVSCLAGERLIGGGSSTAGVGTDAGWAIIRENADGNTWNVTARNDTGSGSHVLFAEAYCLQ